MEELQSEPSTLFLAEELDNDQGPQPALILKGSDVDIRASDLVANVGFPPGWPHSSSETYSELTRMEGLVDFGWISDSDVGNTPIAGQEMDPQHAFPSNVRVLGETLTPFWCVEIRRWLLVVRYMAMCSTPMLTLRILHGV
jgi:hypothetical protein